MTDEQTRKLLNCFDRIAFASKVFHPDKVQRVVAEEREIAEGILECVEASTSNIYFDTLAS